MFQVVSIIEGQVKMQLCIHFYATQHQFYSYEYNQHLLQSINFTNLCLPFFQKLLDGSPPLTSLSLKRHSSETTSDYLPISLAQSFLESVHTCTHLPWWGTIVVTCVGLRCVITLPLAVYQNKLITRIELLQPTLKELTEALKHRVTVESRKEGLSSEAANKVFTKKVDVFLFFLVRSTQRSNAKRMRELP